MEVIKTAIEGLVIIEPKVFKDARGYFFESYNYIASGLATTLIFLYPVLVAVIMVFLKVVPSWPVWLAIAATFGGVLLMTQGEAGQSIDPVGVGLALGSALVYALTVGVFVFLGKIIISGTPITSCITTGADWMNLVGLAILPTIISTAALAVATRNIGATKASVLGVFEPITAILVGTLVFGEPLTANIIIGITIAIVSVTFMITVTKR